jgi:hypothetical protein
MGSGVMSAPCKIGPFWLPATSSHLTGDTPTLSLAGYAPGGAFFFVTPAMLMFKTNE